MRQFITIVENVLQKKDAHCRVTSPFNFIMNENMLINDEIVKIVKNPSSNQIKNMLNEWGLRAIGYHGDIWVWEAYDATHWQIADSLGIPRNKVDEFSISLNPDKKDDYDPDYYISFLNGRVSIQSSRNFIRMVSGIIWHPNLV